MKPNFPKHWGKPSPPKGEYYYYQLPHPYKKWWGSHIMKDWILENQKKDNEKSNN